MSTQNVVVEEGASDRLLGLDANSDDSIQFLGEDNVPLEKKPLVDYVTSDEDDTAVGAVSEHVEEQKTFRFKKATNMEQLEQLSYKSFAPSTDRKIAWAVSLYEEWRQHCLRTDVSERHEISWGSLTQKGLKESDLSFCLCCFINEIRRKDRGEFPSKSLYEIVLLIQFHLEKRGLMWKLVDGSDFTCVWYTLDNVMKKRVETGNCDRKSADPISFEDENALWNANILGKE